jgi:hypothetical protein
MIRSLRLSAVFLFLFLATPAFAASVSKVNKAQETAILKLDANEGNGLKTGDSLSFDAGGETIESEVLGVSGRSVRVKVIYGIDALKDGQKATLSSGDASEAKPKEAVKKDPPHRERKEAPSYSNGSDFVLGAGGTNHPFAGDFAAPFFLGSPWFYGGGTYDILNPAQTTRVSTWMVAGGFTALDAKAENKSDPAKYTTDIDTQEFGFTGIVNIQAGVHVGLTYGKRDLHSKVKEKFDSPVIEDGTSKNRGNHEEISFLFGMPIGERISIGAKLSQISSKYKYEGAADDDSSYQVLIPGMTYQTAQFEVGLVYHPPIEIHESDGSAEVPRSWGLHGQYRLSPEKSLGLQIRHSHWAGIDDDATDNFAVKAGGELTAASWGSFGLYGLFQQKFYMKKDNASPGTIPQTGVQTIFGVPFNKSTHMNAGATFNRAEAKAKRGDDGVTLRSQAISLFASVSYQP